MNEYFIYILASRRNGTLYVGLTCNLKKRIWEHKNGFVSSFTKKYRVYQLVYFKGPASKDGALQFEKRLKKWRRRWKLKLIESMNPDWVDLYDSI